MSKTNSISEGPEAVQEHTPFSHSLCSLQNLHKYGSCF